MQRSLVEACARAGTRALVLTLSLGVAACTAASPPIHRGPVVVITIDTLRADVVGALGGPAGLTPALDALAAEADWAGRAIAPSSWTVPSMASLFTGLQPWRHGVWHGERPALREELRTLPEALAEAGYHTLGFRSNRWLTAQLGYAQGFDEFYDLGQHKRARARLRELGANAEPPRFVWIHVLPPHAPYRKYEHLLPRLEAYAPPYSDSPGYLPAALPDPQKLPARVTPLELEPFYDPARALAPEEWQRFWALYLLNVAWADQQVGELLAALRDGGAWDRTLVIVTSDHGEEFGENGQIVHGGSLHRVLVEVPLLVKLPRGFDRRLEPRSHLANQRIFATVLDAVGGEAGEGVAPSLFEPAELEPLSELYLGNGENSFSLLVGQQQLVWRSRFADPEPEYYAARLQEMGGALDRPLSEPAAAVFERQRRSFVEVPPLSGRGAPELELYRWQAGRAVPEPDADPQLLAERLDQIWAQRNGDDVAPALYMTEGGPRLDPEELKRLRELGYVVGP